MIATDLQPGEPLRADIEEIRMAAHRATDLTRQLLAFSRQQVLEPRIINLNDVVGGTSRLLHRLISEDVRIVITLDPNIHAVYADPGQLEQIIVNLTVNAHDAMPNGGTLTIETENVGLDAEYAEQHPEVVPGDYAVLAVTDTGSGMDEETRSRLFEPFYTTKGPGKGTGLGLSTVYGIVKQSKGHIWVYSELGNGTTLRVYLPKADHTVGVEDATAEAKPASRGDETILFVEDDQAVRSAGAEALRRQGYNVIVAEDGQTALEMMERERTDLDLLVTDVVMPRLGGRILAARIRELAPDTKILFTSGYSREAVVTHGILASNSSFLQKPYSPGQLGRKVREVLDEG
jgi:CheY-like chemotaxis protein